MKYYDSLLVNETIRREPKCARYYCVATAATVATIVGGVAAAGSAAYGAYQSSKMGEGIGKGGAGDLYGSRTKPTPYNNTVNMPSFDAVRGSSDYLAMLPALNKIASGVTKSGMDLREKVFPGSQKIMEGASGNLLALSRGQVAPDVVDSTNRIIAERTGGAYDPSAPDSYAGGQAQSVADFSRAIGRTSAENVDRFLSAAPVWEQLADKFAYTPDEALGGAMDILRTRYQYELGKAGIDLQVDQNKYLAAANINQALAAPNPQAVGAQNDALLRQSIQGISGGAGNYLTAIQGISSGLSGVASGYSNLGSGLNSAGFYGTQAQAIKAGGAGATAAYYGGAGGPKPVGGYYISGHQ